MGDSRFRFVHLGFGFILNASRVVGVFPSRSEQARRMMRFSKANESFVDVTRGRETKAYILLEDGTYIGCAFSPMTVMKRLNEDPVARFKSSDDDEDIDEGIDS